MYGGGVYGMASPSAALTASITCYAIGGSRSHPRVYLDVSCCDVTTGQRDFAFCKCVATSLRTPVIPE